MSSRSNNKEEKRCSLDNVFPGLYFCLVVLLRKSFKKMRKNIIITGQPRVGKSTLLKKIIQTISNRRGFVTNELTMGGNRIGFEIEMKKGDKALLAHKSDASSNLRVSNYNVSIDELDMFSVELMNKWGSDDILYIDEIGQMQLFSVKFQKLVLNYLDSPQTTIMTLTNVFSSDFTEQIRKRDDIILVELHEGNRNEQELFIKELVRKIKKAKYYVSHPEFWMKLHNEGWMLTGEHSQRLIKLDGEYKGCDCDFYEKHKICSHFMAAEELFGEKLSVT